MEPFVSRDGRYLFFNNRNDPALDTDLYWAERIDGLTFRSLGPLPGANSHDLDAVASLDLSGNFYLVSSRDYAATGALIHRGRFRDGRVDGVTVVQGLASPTHPGFNFDAEISADGARLYYVESRRGEHRSRLALADRQGGGFVRDAKSDDILRQVNGEGMVYAPAISADGLELFFTRAAPSFVVLLDPPRIYEARRRSADLPFGPPVQIAAVKGFAEAPTISPDGLSLYYHALVEGRFRLYRVTRAARPSL
jgi:WD40-like Beta Propeller Repeat